MNHLTESSDRPPLKSSDGSMILPWKTNTLLRRTLLDLSDMVPIMLKCEEALGDLDVHIGFNCEFWGQWLKFNCSDEETARKVVGKLWRVLGKPRIEKPEPDKMMAFWQIDKVRIEVSGYKPTTCRYEEVNVELPAEPERTEIKVIEAKPARTEMRRILVCDTFESEPQVDVEVATASSNTEEVPF